MILKVGDRINVMKMARSDSHSGCDKVFMESGFFQCFQPTNCNCGDAFIHAVYMLESGFLKSVDIKMVARVSQ